jgi:aminoglycoside phosphotransferase family enzyme/predicted kinase
MGEADSLQERVLDFLGQPSAYKPRPATVERIDTHASVIFLAGPFAYKVKRAVRYPFLDFSTLERRHQACLNELRVNRRTASQLYLEVIPVTHGEGLDFRLGGGRKVAEWALKMRRFDQAKLFDRMASEGRLALALMPRLAMVIAAFHGSADRVLAPDQAVLLLAGVLRDNADAFAGVGLVPPETVEEFATQNSARLAALSPLLARRASGGYVRHCHGDLHLRNIVEIDGAPVLFDAIEFDDWLATIDVLYDLAFLLMDLGKRGLSRHANTVLNAYLDDEGSTGNLIGLATLPLFLSMRAAIRAKVELLRARMPTSREQAEAARADARDYFSLAQNYLAPSEPRLIAIGGLSGTGKSAVARAIAPVIGAFPGAVVVRSDVERKRLFGVAPTERLPASAYMAEVSDRVYVVCRKRALMALEGGHSVIVDAVQAKPAERDALAALASEKAVPFTGLWLEAPPWILRERVAARSGDVSDATPEVVDTQLGYDIGPQRFDVIDASGPVDRIAAACLARIGVKPSATS